MKNISIIKTCILFFIVASCSSVGREYPRWWLRSDGRDPEVEIDPVRGYRSRGLCNFPDGSRLVSADLAAKRLVVRDKDGSERELFFNYEAYPTTIDVIHAGPDGRMYGSSSHPSFLFVYDPEKDELMFFPDETLNFKAMRTQGKYVFGGHYAGGDFWLLDTSKPVTSDPVSAVPGREITVPSAPSADEAGANPRFLGKFQPNLNIPRGAFAHPDGKHIMICGQPGYGQIGGGIIIYNLETREISQLHHTALVPHSSTMAIAALPDGSLLCGTSPRGGHGTSPVLSRAELYILDWETRKVAWRSGPLEDFREILSIFEGPDGFYYCVTGAGELLVLEINTSVKKRDVMEVPDSVTQSSGLLEAPKDIPEVDVEKKIVHRVNLGGEYGGHTLTTAMTLGPDNKIYLGLRNGILRITPETFEIEPVLLSGVSAGLGIINNRIYFARGGRVMSIPIPPPGESISDDDIVNHGAPVTSSENRGMTAAVDGDGNRVVLIWLMNGGTDRVLVINAENGETKTVPVEPFAGDNAFTIWHSTRGLVYTHYGGVFYEFDSKTLSFSFAKAISGRCAMSMHEDRDGTIWAALYSGANLISYNPDTREMTDHGSMNHEGWAQYPTYMASDSAGWIYVGLGNTLGQLVAFNPATGERRAFISQHNRRQGVGHPFTATDGRVYANAPGWSAVHELFAGTATPLAAIPQREWAAEKGDYDADAGDYFIPPHVFSNWQRVEAPLDIMDALLDSASETRPAVVWAPTGMPAEAEQWFWKSDLDDKFELLIRARKGVEDGEFRVTLNNTDLFKGPPPFEYEKASAARIPVPREVVREKNNILQIRFVPASTSMFSQDSGDSVNFMTIHYAVFKR